VKELRGAVAVVTGAGAGIGRALAHALSRNGVKLALADINAAGLQGTLSLLESTSARVYQVDVSDASAVDQFAYKVQEDFGRVSLLINNAGVALYGTFAEISLEDMEWLFKINFWGVVHACKSFMRLLQQEQDAHIVNMSSIFGLVGPPGQAAYASSKFAVRGFSEVLHHELKGSRINVSCVHPAGIQTEIADHARIGSGANAQDAAVFRERFKKLTPTSPAQAARTILAGIVRNRPRILIGADAGRIDAIQRLAPSRGVDALISLMEKRAPVPNGS